MWIIDVGYDADKWTMLGTGSLDDQLVEAAGGEEHWESSGMGWGIRDIQFAYDHYTDAEKAMERIVRVFNPPKKDTDEYIGMSQEVVLP